MGLFNTEINWFPLDPDNRKDAPEIRDGKGSFIGYKPHCVRCHKPLKGATVSYIACTVDWDMMEVRKDPLGKELIGQDCFNICKQNKK